MTDQTLRISGQGDCGVNNGPNGDLLIVIGVKSHPIFRREGYDIHCDIPVTYAEAVLGAEITVPLSTATSSTLSVRVLKQVLYSASRARA